MYNKDDKIVITNEQVQAVHAMCTAAFYLAKTDFESSQILEILQMALQERKENLKLRSLKADSIH